MRGLALIISFLLAILCMIIPVAPWLTDIWPVWIIPLLIYWIMALPHRVGLSYAWISGLVLDILFNSLLGAHALALLILAAFFRKMSQRFSFFSGLQQMIFITFLTAVYLLILSCIQIFNGQSMTALWWPAITTGLVWPVIFSFLRHYRQHFRIT